MLDHKSRAEWEAEQQQLEGETTFAYKLRLKRGYEEYEAQSGDMFVAQYREFIPDMSEEEDKVSQISPEQRVLDDFISMISITDAYNQWADKGHCNPGGRKDSIKVRCPNPAHPDHDPSCWLNTEKNVFNCAKCGGGDIWDIAAWRFGYPVPGYKADPASFRALREAIGDFFGLRIEKGIAGDPFVVQTPQLPIAATTATVTVTEPDSGQSYGNDGQNVIYTAEGSEAEELKLTNEINASREFPGIPWRDIVPEDTFLRAYLDATTADDSPEEFHFWNGLLGLGMAVGGMRTLEDSPEVAGNLFVCHVGGTGTGKSKSKRHLTNLIHEALPYKRDDQPPFGAQYLNGIQSGEVLIKQFQHDMVDPIDGKLLGYWPFIRALVDFEEMAELIGKNNRQGSTLKTTLMNLYDSPRWLSSTSMTHGNIGAERPFGSAVTTTQFKSIRTLISRNDDNSGFANRWTFASGIPKKPFSVNRVRVDLTRASSMLTGINMATRAHELITWNTYGEAAWDKFFHNVYIPQRERNDVAITQRVDLMMKKLFLLFAINENSKVITADIVMRVMHLYHHVMETYGVVEFEIAASEESDENDLILRHVMRMTGLTGLGGRGPTANELYKVMKRKNSSIGKFRKNLENLVVLGMLIEHKVPPGPQGGRPTSAYTLPPGAVVRAS